MTHVRADDPERKGLWEIRFVLSGLRLPKDEVIVNDKLRFVRAREVDDVRLPSRAFVKVIGKPSRVRSLAERYLNDFIGIYATITRSAVEVIRDDGANELQSKFVPLSAKSLRSMTRTYTVHLQRKVSKGELNKNVKIAEKMLSSTNLSRKAMSYLRVALDYLINSKSSLHIEDKLINCIIAMEALFGERDELKYRISHRLSCLLGRDDDSREYIFTKMKMLYDKRSDLVHGRKTDLTSDDIKKAQSYLQDSITRFMVLSQSYSREIILERLDNAVINNKKRRELQRECRRLLQEYEFDHA